MKSYSAGTLPTRFSKGAQSNEAHVMSNSSVTRPCQLREVCVAVAAVLAVYTSTVQAADAPPAIAQAAGAKAAYDLAPGALADTLKAISQISGQTVRMDANAVEGHQAPGVKGELTARDAVAAAVEGSGLEVRFRNGVIEVEPQRVEILAKRDAAETSFKADLSDTATRSGTDLMDTPASVTIITSDVLKSQQATNLMDALANVSGVGFTQSPEGAPQFNVRGFGETSQTVNGVSDRAATDTNVYGIERIEVLKGPQAILQGGDSLGGGINIVMKKPTSDPVRDLTLQSGTHFDTTIAGDVSGPVSEDDKRLTYRVIASGAHADSSPEGKYAGRRDYFAMPELRWKDQSTDVTAGVSYESTHRPVPEYTFANKEGILPPPAMPLSNPLDGFDVKDRKLWYDLQQKLSPAVTFISRIQWTVDSLELHLWTPLGLTSASGGDPTQTDGTAYYFPGPSLQHSSQVSGDHYFRFEFGTGPVQHKLSAGFGHDDYTVHETEFDGDLEQVQVYPASNFNFPATTSVATALIASLDYLKDSQRSEYAQDLLNFGNWSALLSFRHTAYTLAASERYPERNRSFLSPTVTVSSNTPGAGLVYRVSDAVSLYGSFSKGFVPETSLSCSKALLPPILSSNKEVGAKFQFFGNLLSVTTSAFELSQTNSALYDPIHNCDNTEAGEKTKGVEIDVQGQLAKGWNAIMNYTFQTVRDQSDPATPFPGQPKNKFNVWTTYDFPFEPTKGLGMGLGITANTKELGSQNANSQFIVPAQAEFDASVFYNRPTWHLTLGVKNIADRRLYGISTSNAYVPILPGRTVMATFIRNFN
jgi:iron complex outermembrane receptor protein